MLLKNLTLFGFKSFVDRLTIDFQPGLTALVGPNGCGKSNIVDAIRWVLGEQSPKSLRGERMEDLIFAGNAHRKPTGMAEVSLTLTNIAGRLPIPYDEVTVTRRLYRSGESEYLLNQQPCRLKDITRLFLDSGLGREPYALIQQGAIGSMLNARPPDRRALLEEAAGTMSYKVKRNIALGRLEAAEQNLLRVRDVLQEIERQRNSLYRQAKKAERHQRLTARLQEIETLLVLAEDRRLDAELAEVSRQEQQDGEALASCQVRIAHEETSRESNRLQDLDLENRIAAAHERLFALRSQRDRHETEHQAREGLLQAVRRRGEERDGELRTVADRLHRLRQDLETEAKARVGTEEELEVIARYLRELTEGLARVEHALHERAEVLERRKGELVELTERVVGHGNTLASLRERQRLLRQDRDSLDRQLTGSQTEAETVTTRERELAQELDALAARVSSLTQERTAQAAELGRLGIRHQALGERRAAVLGDLRELEGRLTSLRELEEGLAGLSDGQQFLLRGKAAGVTACQVIGGPLSRVLRVDVTCERAVEALLGDLQQGLLIPTAEDGLAVIRYLQEENGGCATLLPRDGPWLSDTGGPSDGDTALTAAIASLEPELAQRVIGPALRFIKSPNELRPLLRSLLGDAVIVQDLPTALSLLRRLPGPVRVATTSGAVVSSRGTLQGGSAIALSLLSRHRELEELPTRIARTGETLHAIEREWEELQQARTEGEQAFGKQEASLKAAEEARHRLERSVAEVQTIASRLGSQTAFLRTERDRLDQELRELGEALAKAQGTLETWGRQEETLKRDTAELAQEVGRLQEERQDLHQSRAETRIRTTSLEERREALGRSTERLETDLTTERTRETELLREAEEDRSQEAALIRDIDALRHRLEVLREQEAQEAEGVQVLQRNRDQTRETLLVQEETLKALRRELTDVQQQQAATGARLAALRTERSLLQRRLQEAAQGAALQALADHEGPPPDPEALAGEADELRGKLGALGAINMAALEEFDALSERHRFMSDQATDLTASVTSLKATITEINRTIKELFAKTLTAVNEHLNRYWQRLFGGGEAELVFSEGDEHEEPGVEIRVRIPGKRMTILSLLSGGEKSLGALAFLMALWATRPSPFIVLDEVDAALDDVNVDRFTVLLRELTLSSQVIVVTHHPRTIEFADLLYGITMEEQGVSRLISVRLGTPTETPVPAASS